MKNILTNVLCAFLGFFTMYLMLSFYTLTLNISNMLPEHRYIILFAGTIIAIVYVGIYNDNKIKKF